MTARMLARKSKCSHACVPLPRMPPYGAIVLAKGSCSHMFPARMPLAYLRDSFRSDFALAQRQAVEECRAWRSQPREYIVPLSPASTLPAAWQMAHFHMMG